MCLDGLWYPIFDSATHSLFDFHGYQLTEEGDIIAIENFLCLKGHSSQCPCRSGLIRGVHMLSGSNKVYYAPLHWPITGNGPNQLWDSKSLPPRLNKSFRAAVEHISQATTKKYARQLQQHYGIKCMPALSRVNSLDYGQLCPWEWLHLFGENVIPTMIDIWTGRFKDHDEGTGCYFLSNEDWAFIGQETAEAMKFIPSDFVRLIGNIAEDRSTFTAESYTFWFMYIAPHLLKGRFRDEKYYTHSQALVDIMKATLQFEITHDEIDSRVEIPCR
jgi:hypothetical protein